MHLTGDTALARKPKPYILRPPTNTARARPQPASKANDPEETTKKWGLEAGLWSIFASKDAAGVEKPGKGAQAKQLLAQYGSAYLITSISFAIVSFAACYALVSSGADPRT